ncbi:hypothetical protein FS749_015859 [Ceratobasidium sp. UAMH 11750]|nr:hypothetical protein FS749_015859 [Ceratobasidium sp. UAMH 11750]
MTITLDPSPSFQRLEDALDHAAKHYPTRTAATYLDDGTYRRVSYDQLNLAVHELANILGRHLGSSTRDDTPFVGLFFARNLNQVVATLAVLTAGAAYVPIALDSNATNLGVILAQTKLQVVLTDSDQDGRLKHLLEQAGRLDIAVLDVSKPSGFDTLPTHNGPQPRDGQSPAYVLFSSGTTGAPKGIVTSHTAALTYCRGANELYQAASTDVWVRAAAYTFDSSIDELFCPLVAGAGIVIQPDGALTSFHSYLGFLKTSGATILALTTALWHQLTTYLVHEDRDLPSSIRVVSIGGEAALGKVFKAWRERFKDYPRLLNGYGPTEATVCATYWEAHDNINIPILPIGRPLTGYRCYILDPATHSPVGAGHEGMLYVSGPGLAIGYLNDPAQTQSKFVPNPWAESTEYARMYCTGDLARMDPGGVLHFAGRADLQVKIRGFRVELESVETCLLSFSGVKEVAVAAHKDEQAQSQSIHAYIIMASDKSDIYADDIVAHCAQTLAPYEIPARFYRVESLPYTRNRKLDRRALNETKNSAKLLPSRERAVDGEVGKLDPVLAQLWCECLDGIDLESLSASSHFLHLGGHSLTLIMLAAKIDSVLGVVVSSVDLLQNPTLDQMSKLLEPHRHKAIPNEHASLSGPKLGRGCGVSFMGKLVGKAAKRFGSLGLLRFLPFRQAEKPQSVLEKTGGPVRDLDVGTHPLSSAQARLYVAQQSAPESPVFNDGVAINITGEISDQDMCAALKALLQRHAILRVKLFQDDAAQVLQEILPFDEALFDEAFSHYKLERSEAARRAHEIFVRPFNLFEGRLIRIALLSSGAEHILVICAHHIIWDGFSDRGKLDDRAKFTRYPLSNGAAHTDMVCFVELNKDGSLLGEIEYDSEIFAHESMASFASAFANILDSWSAQPTQSISGIAFPGSASHIPLVRELSPEDCSFGAFLVSSAARHWSCQAVYDDTTGGTYTYQQVFSMAHRIQQQLCPFRRVDGVVVLLLERNVDAVAVEIGVSLAGLAFAPCDISQPRLRTEEIIANCDPVCILAHRRVLDKLGVSDTDFSAPVLVVDGLQDGLPLLGSSAELRVENGGEVAYMIHTSGSTGKPKGIVIGQGSLVKVTREIISWAGGDVAISSVTTSNLAWDGICAQIWPPLGTGGCVKLPKLDGEKDGEYLSALMRRAPPTNSLLATPSAFQMWLDQTQDQPLPLFPDGVRHLMVGGEQLTPELAQRVLSQTGGSPNMHLIHPYGPTEGTVFSSYGVLKHTDLRKLVKYRRVPVDTLLPDAAMTVVDATGHELPRGFVGEIIIWGPCLMLEYLNMPDLNKQKMLVKDGVRGWRSGDLGRHLPSGGFEIFGRMDSMRKVKGGFRVDLGEIETHIHSYTQVLKCCVLLMEIPMEDGQVSQNHIVAFVKLKDEEALQMGNSQEGDEFDSIVPEMTLNGLHRHLSHRVPAYMVPDYVVRVNTFPLTNSIKIDRFKLPKPSLVHRFAARASDCVEWTDEDESRRETIEAILSIFTNVLSVDRKLTHRDNFYDCGGHSLLATRVTSLIRRNLGVPLPFTAIITHPTASELAEFVETLRLQSARSISLPPHVIPLQPAGFISKPKAMVFAFPFIGGDLDMLPRVVNQLDNVKLGLVTYGLVPEPGRKLNSLEKMAKTYAESIAQLAGSMPCILVGWCFGGMIASKASLYLPKETTYLVLFDVMHISIAGRFQMDGADFAKAFAEYLCKVWFGPGLQSAEKSGEKAAVVQAVLDAKLDWHDLPSLVALARRHVVLPPWVTDDDLAQRIRPLADSHDLVLGIYRGNCCTPAEAIAIEEQVIVNMQATDGLNNIFDTEVGLGWARYEVVDTDHDTIGYLPVATTRMLSAIRKILA